MYSVGNQGKKGVPLLLKGSLPSLSCDGPQQPLPSHTVPAPQDRARAGGCGPGSTAALPGAGPKGSREPPDTVHVTAAGA